VLPPGDAQAREALEKSPRHGEWMDIKIPGSEAFLRTWVVYPERKDKAPVVIVIHEIFGLTDWIRSVADQLARDGFIAVAPDLLSGKGPAGGNTESFSGRDEVTKAVRALVPEDVHRSLDAVRGHGLRQTGRAPRSGSVGEAGRASGMRRRSRS
jgi:carboxymethylenebutenolidase